MKKFPDKKYNKISNFFDDYKAEIFESISETSLINLKKAVDTLEKKILLQSNIFVCGNGGSAAIANHYICDFIKGLRTGTDLKPKFFSLVSSIETISAIGNDISYSEIFKYQLESLSKKNDLVIFVSSSGNSLNIKKALDYCLKNKIITIGFCGFKGGYLKKNSTIPVYINNSNYGVVEDSHHILMHIILQFLRQKYMKNSKIKKLKF
jgi:D-sedoheptulose 7-phosphate isomerase/D-glycero-D-manno-heptose 1,7-bisphosphate phosphatase